MEDTRRPPYNREHPSEGMHPYGREGRQEQRPPYGEPRREEYVPHRDHRAPPHGDHRAPPHGDHRALPPAGHRPPYGGDQRQAQPPYDNRQQAPTHQERGGYPTDRTAPPFQSGNHFPDRQMNRHTDRHAQGPPANVEDVLSKVMGLARAGEIPGVQLQQEQGGQ